MLLAGAPLAAPKAQTQRGVICERRESQLDGPNAPGWVAREERAATSVRRVGGEATVRALDSAVDEQISTTRVPELSLRRRRVLLVAAHSSPCGAARGSVTLAANAVMAFVELAIAAFLHCDCARLARPA